MEKKETINLSVKILAGILITIGVFMAVPMIWLAAEIIGSRMAPDNMEMPITLKRFGLGDIEANNPGLLTAYMISLFTTLLACIYALVHALGRAVYKIAPMGRIERIVTWAVFGVSLCSLLYITGNVLSTGRDALLVQPEDRNTYMGIKMDEFSRNYLSKEGWVLTKHENISSEFVRKGEHYSGNPETGYLDSWEPNAKMIYQAEKKQPVEAGTYRVICSARAEGPGCYIFATTTSKQSGVKLVEIPHYGNSEGEIWENALDGSAEKDANLGNGYGWSKIVVVIEVKDHDTLVYGVTTDPAFTGKPNKAHWFSAADFSVERVGQN